MSTTIASSRTETQRGLNVALFWKLFLFVIALLVGHAAGEVNQNRCEGGTAFQVRDFSDGLGGCATRVVRGDLGAHPAVWCAAAFGAWLTLLAGRHVAGLSGSEG